uniref:Uncharacterized protein n=1 Tax=Sinocyclocheilus grahami TaxID=75366 RepID=A0A672S618_SINGR
MHAKHVPSIYTPKSIFAYQYHEFSFLFGVLFICIFMRPGSIIWYLPIKTGSCVSLRLKVFKSTPPIYLYLCVYICLSVYIYIYILCVSQLIIGIILNVVSAGLAITAVVLYSVDLANSHTYENCENGSYHQSRYNGYGYSYETPSPEDNRRKEMCLFYKNLIENIFRGLDIMMIVLSVLQLCVTISFCVLTGKALCKKDEDDSELHKPLLEDDTPGAV